MGSGKRWKIATVRGIPVYVSTSWVFVVVFVAWSQYASLLRSYPTSVSESEGLVLAIVITALFFGSVLVHESAHAVMARALGLPVMGITMVFWGGATETKASGRGAGGEFLVAFVGPASTLALAGVFWLVSQAIEGVAADLIGWLAWISLLFAGLNTLPGFPLDGGRMLLAAAWGLTGNRRTAMKVAGYVGLAVGIGMATVALLSISRGDTGTGIFVGYIAFVLIATGRSMDQRIAFRDQLVRGTVADAMRPASRTVPADLSLAETLDRYLRGSDGSWFPVVDDGRTIGTVSFASASRVGARDPLRPTSEAMVPLAQTPVLTPDETLDDAVEWLAGRQGLVLRDGVLAGLIGPADIERWYRRVIEGKVSADTMAVGVPPRPDL